MKLKSKKICKNIKEVEYIGGIGDFTCDDSWSILKDEVNEGRRKMRQIISSIQPEVQLNPKTSAKTINYKQQKPYITVRSEWSWIVRISMKNSKKGRIGARV